jgi:glycosyltransferase involved in cell wall biosynthesis
MPTANRRAFVPHAIQYFLRQDYPRRELVILDSGEDGIADLIPTDPRIRYLRDTRRWTLGAKRNALCEEAQGDLIIHWDDDDWHAPNRLRYQIEALRQTDAEVSGLRQMLFYDCISSQTWLYDYPAAQRPWLAGGSLLYWKELWRKAPFPDAAVGEDTRFVRHPSIKRLFALPDYRFYVALIHPGNTSPKIRRGAYWSPWPDDIKAIAGTDLDSACQETPQVQPVKEVSAMRPNTESTPTYAILMVVHNARAMTQVTTLQTLRYCAGQDARLIVADNASSDGVETWLDLLAARGDVDLIRNPINQGHGPALEQARQATRSSYLVTLDSDAFPLAPDWLTRLRERLQGRVRVAGILHHRDYIHPSCLIIARQTLDELGLTFLGEKDRPSRLDVAERISVELKARGYAISGLVRTAAQRRGSAAEPVYLGSEYEGLVYHQWYSTRAAISSSGRVDDVPMDAIDQSLRELLARFQEEPRDLAVIMGLRAPPEQSERARNALACLRALNLQDLPRWRYRLILVEQDREPYMKAAVAPYVDRYVFAPNPGAYNRGWAFNIGACLVKDLARFLCLIDADLLIPPDFLRQALDAFATGARAVQPYSSVAFLDDGSTARAIADWTDGPPQRRNPADYGGRVFTTSQGGCLFVATDLYHSIGGHDERFRGWGYEDREFWDRLARLTPIVQLPLRILHMDHPRPDANAQISGANRRLAKGLDRTPEKRSAAGPLGRIDRYSEELPQVRPTERMPGFRNWEHWHKWNTQRIERIFKDEQQSAEGCSPRCALARIVAPLGDRILDLGCGPGPLWPYLDPYRPRLDWSGVDVTGAMLQAAQRLYPGVPLVRADGAALPFREGSFDVVVMRHLVEHLPVEIMQAVLKSASRVARAAIVIDFNLVPVIEGGRHTTRVGEGFIETRWCRSEIDRLLADLGWLVADRIPVHWRGRETGEVWIVRPIGTGDEVVPTIDENLKFSIVMPTYRRAHTLARTVTSIQAQRYRNWELIIVDNAGDGVGVFDDPRIHVFRHCGRASAAYARNRGLEHASGDLVCFFDDDDDMYPQYLYRFAEAFAANPQAKMARAGMLVSDGRTNLSLATPECCLRREYAVPAWSSRGPGQDQRYFRAIITKQQWSEEQGDIAVIPEALCRANMDPNGGLRSGQY